MSCATIDFALVEKLANFDRERIPERVVHARGASAKGFFEVRRCGSSIATSSAQRATRSPATCESQHTNPLYHWYYHD